MPEQNSQTNRDVNTAAQRHWLYGFNAAVLVIVGLVVLGFILVICDRPVVRNYTRWDWSSTRANSLSSASRKMLQELDKGGQNYVLVSLLTDPTDEDRRNNTDVEQAQRRQQVADLLREYARNSSHIKVEDKGDSAKDELELMIRERYRSELEPYEEVIRDFNPLAAELRKFMTEEAAAIGAFGQRAGTPQEEIQAAAMLQAAFSSAPTELEQINRTIDRETGSILPQWNRLKGYITDYIDESEPLFKMLSNEEQVKQAMPPTLAEYFISAKDRYKVMADKLEAYKDRLGKLERLKVEDVLSGVEKNSVLILGPESAKVVPNWELYSAVRSNEQSAAASNARTFNGEQAISSALYGLAKPDKVKVVFVGGAQQRLTTGLFADTTRVLEQNNFQVLEWSPQEQRPGMPADPNDEPPAKGKGVVWVVFPPEAPDMQMMMMGMPMPNPQALIAATRGHLDEGGAVMFLAETANTMLGAGGFPFDELVSDFGIQVEAKYTIICLREMQNRLTGEIVRQPYPYIEIDRFEDHEITRPIQSLATVFGPLRTSQTGMSGYTTLVKVASPVPEGVEAQVLVTTPRRSDYWGESDLMDENLKFDRDADVAAPVPLAAAAIRNRGQEGEQRVMAIGSKFFASDPLVTSGDLVMRGGRIEQELHFPGNSELMRNAVLWLAGYENMIAVSSKGDPAGRIGDIRRGTLNLVRMVVVGLVPLATLVVGGFIWSMRRR